MHATAFRNAGNIATLAAAVLSSIGFVLMVRQRAEEEVRRKEEDLREAQRITHIGSWYWDASTDATTGSDELLRIYGLDPATEAMPPFKEQDGRLYPHDSWEKINAGVQETLETGVGYKLDVEAIRGGAKIWVTTRSEAVRDANGHIVGLRGTVQDISERKQAEEEKERLFAELSAERARWQATVENMLDPVTVCDAEGRATYMNRAYQKLIERPIAKNLGVEAHPDYYQLYRPDGTRFPAEELPLQKAARTGEDVRDVELIQRSAGGREFTAIFSAAPLRDPTGRVTGAVAVGRDITEQRRVERVLKDTLDELESRVQERTAELQQAYDRLRVETEERERVEAQLRQAQKMEALGTLSGGIAHDFNNILAAIVGFTELIQERLPKGSQEMRHAKRVLEAGLRGRDLVKQMLTFSRKTEQEKKPLRLSSVVQEAMKLLRASIPSTISVRVKVDGASELVFADSIQMQQVLMNLCTNAAHAMQEKGGILDVELSAFNASGKEWADGMKPGPYMRLIVRDTGVGIPAGIMDKIFDPFFTTKKLGEGTGLGLSVVHGIVKQHGGYITVTSDPGRGSVFTVYLPKIAGEDEVAAIVDDALPTGCERILFVDDEEALVEMGEDMLAELGYEVISRMNGHEALALFRLDPSRFDLVITDQTMPEMTGVDLAKEILAIRADTPIIMCTGFSHVVNADKAKAAGIRAFAMKPLTKREIARTIRQVLDR